MCVVKYEVNLPCHRRGTALAIKGKPEQRSNNPKASITWLPKRPMAVVVGGTAAEVIMLMMKKAALAGAALAPTLLTIPKMNRIMTSNSRFFSSSRRLTVAVSGTNLLYFSDHQWNDFWESFFSYDEEHLFSTKLIPYITVS